MSIERLLPNSPEWDRHWADHVARYLFAAPYVAGKRVLDAGTGGGYGAALLLAAGASSVTAVDIDQPTLDKARAQFTDDRITFVRDDCETLANVHGPFDVICSFEAIEHLRNPGAFIAAAARVLSPDGVLLCSTPDRAATAPYNGDAPANPYHINEWYRHEFEAMLAPHFGGIDLRSQVISASLRQRKDTVDSLRSLLWDLCENPVIRLGRRLQRLWNKGSEMPRVDGLAAASATDYPIVPAGVAPFVGTSWCHVAVCTKPRVQGVRAA